MEPFVGEGILVPRTAEDLEKRLKDYVVYEVDGTVHGCGALHVFPEKQGEIAGVSVDDAYANLGIGTKIVTYLIAQAATLKLKEVFVLTTQSADWFTPLGFRETDVSKLPKQKREAYNPKRNSRVLIHKLSKRDSRTHIGPE
jgi:amino-acid N-acetyltransferase